MVVVALLSVYLVESVYVVSVYLVVNCNLKLPLKYDSDPTLPPRLDLVNITPPV